jgi:DNA-binding transcriptional LysR family regulator
VAELSTHDAVTFRGPSGRLRPWSVLDGGRVREISPTPVVVLSDGQAFIEAAINGLGIAQILDRVAQPHVEAGKLEHVLPTVDVPGPPVHALIPLGHRMAARTRAVLNHLADSLRTPL